MSGDGVGWWYDLEGCPDSGQDFTNDAFMHVGDAIVTSLVAIGEVFMVEAEKVEYGGMEIVRVRYLLP